MDLLKRGNCLRLVVFVILVFFAGFMFLPGKGNNRPHGLVAKHGESRPTSGNMARAIPDRKASVTRLPLNFEPNRGQIDKRVNFISRGRGHGLFFEQNSIAIVSQESRASRTQQRGSIRNIVRMKLEDGNLNPEIVGLDRQPGIANYLIGKNRERWRTNIPTFAKVSYKKVYSGIDVIFYGREGFLEFDYIVAPGANPNDIAFSFEGIDLQKIDDNGDLNIQSDLGELKFFRPSIHQMRDGKTVPVKGQFAIREDSKVGFTVASYDKTLPLVIDPILTYSTTYGGTGLDEGKGIAVDDSGNTYVAGWTLVVDFPFSSGAYQETKNGFYNCFVTKIAADGATVLYSTLLGGSYFDKAFDIDIDDLGNAYITGVTSSDDFPTVGPVQADYGGDGVAPLHLGLVALESGDAFVAKLNASGSALVYSTFLGGGGIDNGFGIAVDSDYNAHVTGVTTSGDFPVDSAIQSSLDGDSDAFMAKFNADGSALTYSTYYGGDDAELGFAIAVNSSGEAVAVGTTYSSDFPTSNPLPNQTGLAGAKSVFITELNSTGGDANFSTYLGGNSSDEGFAVTVDSDDKVYVTGSTKSSDFPTKNAYQSALVGAAEDVFVSKIDTVDSEIVFSTYLGGTYADYGYGIAVDALMNVFVAGKTQSADFPAVDSLYSPNGGVESYSPIDPFVAQFDATGVTLLYSTYFGGSNNDYIEAIDIDGDGDVHVVGTTYSSDFPTKNSIQETVDTYGAIFIAEIETTNTGFWISTVTPSAGGNSGQVTLEIRGGGFDDEATVKLTRDGETDVTGTVQEVSDTGRVITATFEFSGQTKGDWDLVVENPGGQSVGNAGGFTLEDTVDGGLDISILCRKRIRIDRPTTCFFNVTNNSNVDKVNVPASAINGGVSGEINGKYEYIPPSDDGTWVYDVSPNIDGNDGSGPIIIPLVPAKFNQMTPITLTYSDYGDFNLNGNVFSPLSASQLACMEAIMDTFLNATDLIMEKECFVDAVETIGTGMAKWSNRNKRGVMGDLVAEAAFDCVIGLTLLGKANDALDTAASAKTAFEECGNAEGSSSASGSVVTAIDPNEIVGLEGTGDEHYIEGDETMQYAIYFENQESATAAAQEVFVTTVALDATVFDLSSVSIGPATFGDQVVTLSTNPNETTEVDLRPDENLLVRITTEYSEASGILKWTFTSLDPDTGEYPEDAEAGFLPPNRTPPEGDGSVSFSIKLNSGLESGTEISSQASIVFDANDAIETNVWTNTITLGTSGDDETSGGSSGSGCSGGGGCSLTPCRRF